MAEVRPVTRPTAGTGSRPATRAKAGPRRRTPADPARAWARRLAKSRPGLVPFVLERLAEVHGRPTWERRLDPMSELVLTILSQNSADINAERAFESLRRAFPSDAPPERHLPGGGWGGIGLSEGSPPDWSAVESAKLADVIEAIRPGGLAVSKSPRIQAALRFIREERGDYSLEFLGDMAARDARAWLTRIDGIGKKTASVLLLFCFGLPLMPVDRHVERVSKRIGLVPGKADADDAHEVFLALLEPDQMYEAHVNLIRHGRLICHARNPEHARCPLIDRCRFVNARAP